MKILVDEIPKKPCDCSFSQLGPGDDPDVVPHCQLRLNKFAALIGHLVNYHSLSEYSCFLAEDKTCPYLTTIGEHNQKYVEGPDVSDALIFGGPRSPIDRSILDELEAKRIRDTWGASADDHSEVTEGE